MLKFIARKLMWQAIAKVVGGKAARNARTAQQALRLARRLKR